MNKDIFKAYDVRGVYPGEIDEEAVYTVARAYCSFLKPKKVVLGRDVRISGESLFKAARKAFSDAGVDVTDIGVVTTDMLYFAVAYYGYDGGISITASHDSAEYNGLKMVSSNAKPVCMDSGLEEIKTLALKGDFTSAAVGGKIEKLTIIDDYLGKILSFIDEGLITRKKIVANPNFGAAGKIVDQLAERLKLEIVKLNYEENGLFPKGRPDPLREETHSETIELVKKTGADFGVAWDADADRCFFYDETGSFVDAYYAAANLIPIVLEKYPGGKIVHDIRLTWALDDLITADGGVSLVNEAGHAFIKERMRKEKAVFGCETSGHFYFKDFYYCDNGMIPFLLMLQKLCESGEQVSHLIEPLRRKYPISGEINFKIADKPAKLEEIKNKYADGKQEFIDGISVSYPEWRFNVRTSNTEPLLRLNIEAKTKALVDEKVDELKKLITK